jgi:hypothetical protein
MSALQNTEQIIIKMTESKNQLQESLEILHNRTNSNTLLKIYETALDQKFEIQDQRLTKKVLIIIAIQAVLLIPLIGVCTWVTLHISKPFTETKPQLDTPSIRRN